MRAAVWAIGLAMGVVGMALLLWHCPSSYGEEKPPGAEQHFRQARHYEQTGQLNLAIQEYRAVIEIDPKFGPAFFNLGLIYKNGERWPQAIEMFTQCLALEPSDGESEFFLSVAYGLSGDPVKALEHYQRSQALGFSTSGSLQYRPLSGTPSMVMVQFNGTSLTDNQVRYAGLRQIEKFRSVRQKISQVVGRQRLDAMFETIDVTFLGWKGHRTWFERWTNRPRTGDQESYNMEFTLEPGGRSTTVDAHPADLTQ